LNLLTSARNQTEVREDLARLDEELRSFSDGGLDLSKLALDSPPGSGDAGADYIETKLDLAAAYLDMGDQVGAKGLLDDVLQEGDATQKKRADEMLKKLG
jgi:pilus assembly protein FimV